MAEVLALRELSVLELSDLLLLLVVPDDFASFVEVLLGVVSVFFVLLLDDLVVVELEAAG